MGHAHPGEWTTHTRVVYLRLPTQVALLSRLPVPAAFWGLGRLAVQTSCHWPHCQRLRERICLRLHRVLSAQTPDIQSSSDRDGPVTPVADVLVSFLDRLRQAPKSPANQRRKVAQNLRHDGKSSDSPRCCFSKSERVSWRIFRCVD